MRRVDSTAKRSAVMLNAKQTERSNGRDNASLRPLKLTRQATRYAEGSVLIELGHTRVLCTATVEAKVPGFLKGQGQGWVSAE
ncbi:MAG: hypothetical protein EBV92_01785, partial [Betaproteobacteria bacterium]|nr:hypothetical protein [Betaproteobacteria bacterium]